MARGAVRFGASSFIWCSPFGDEHLRLAQHVADLGYDVFEICVEDPGRISSERVREASEQAGVGVSVCGVFGHDRDASHEDPAARERAREYLRFCVDLAAAVGSPHVAGPMYSAVGKTRTLPDREREQQRRSAAESLREVGEYAGERGIALAIEPLNRFETDLINTVEQGLDLCDRIGLDNVGLLLDTFHMNIEEKDVAAAIALAGPRIKHVQASENDRGTPGTGQIPWNRVGAALRAAGYDGLVTVEAFNPDIEEIARAVSLWRPMASSGDALAQEALAFLRDALLRSPAGNDGVR